MRAVVIVISLKQTNKVGQWCTYDKNKISLWSYSRVGSTARDGVGSVAGRSRRLVVVAGHGWKLGSLELVVVLLLVWELAGE